MSLEEHKALVRRFVEEIWNEGNIAAVSGFFTPDFVDHTPVAPDVPSGAEGAKQSIAMYKQAFPDLRFTIHDIVGEGDRLVWRWSSRGTHLGALSGIAATGRTVTTAGVEIYRLANGRIAERWGFFDLLGLLTQLGAIPS